MRTETEIFRNISMLCSEPGYIHVIAYFCFRDHIVKYKHEVRAEEYIAHFSGDRLIRTEIMTLIGLMLRTPRDFTVPAPERFQELVEQSEALLRELHEALNEPGVAELHAAIAKGEGTHKFPISSAAAMREPIFYAAESAYSCQYRDLSVAKYARDHNWLAQHKGFSPLDAKEILSAIYAFLNNNIFISLKKLKEETPETWTVLNGFTFSVDDIVERSGLTTAIVQAVIEAFLNPDDGNPTFTSLHEFNSAHAYPIINHVDDRYVLFLGVSLAEALYETPFYWMIEDNTYRPIAMRNRGLFTEEFTASRLERVFGEGKVFRNVNVWETARQKKKLGEIDALVLIGDRAVVVQAKSKRLTLSAQKGNDLQLQADFRGAVQEACDQAVSCSQNLVQGTATLTDSAGRVLPIPRPLNYVYPLCVVSDHYPALSFQARQFLEYTVTHAVQTPLVCDVFFVDVLTEFLESPLRFLSYLELRAKAGDNVVLSHETIALGFHLKRNLWLGEYDLLVLEDDVSADIDIAMFARREGIQGKRTPPGILTHLRGTPLAKILETIETRSEAGALGVGLELLKLSGESANDLNLGIKKIAKAAARDGRQHDITIALTQEGGITVHCNSYPTVIAAQELHRHCELRKYSTKAAIWCGLSIEPQTMAPRFGVKLDYAWKRDTRMDEATANMAKPQSIAGLRAFLKSRSENRKIGRNDPCTCGSGIKYKRCCMLRA